MELYVLSLHSSSHSNEEIILNSLFYQELKPSDLIQIYDPNNPQNRFISRVPPPTNTQSTLEISMQKTIAEAVGLVQFSKVMVDRVTEDEATLDFVELSFKKQYLQRGNMFRFKQALIGRTIHLNQNVSLLGMQAQIQELKKGLTSMKSGLVTEDTKLVFRSKSARIIWLVQISAEMWDVDPDGDMYFDKFLKEFVGPIFDSWKNLGVSHMLTVIFFARTIYLDRITRLSHPDFISKKSVSYNNGYHQQDFFKIVVENIADIDKVSLIKQLKQEFWAFPKILGWKIPFHAGQQTPLQQNDVIESSTPTSSTATNNELDPTIQPSNRPSAPIETAVPSDSVHGNFLGAINTSLNILEKHYMDRDLNRTGNSIVMISAGCGVFKVKPHLSQITKQRMLDSAFGIDFISLSRPPLHTVPLFIVTTPIAGGKDFYEMPHWMRVSYIDCHKPTSLTGVSNALTSYKSRNKIINYDQEWSKEYIPHPSSFLLTSILTYSTSLVALKQSYIAHLPFALKELLYQLSREQQLLSTSPSPRRAITIDVSLEKGERSGLPSPSSFSTTKSGFACVSSISLTKNDTKMPQWGKPLLTEQEEAESKRLSTLGHSTDSIILTSDIVKLRLVSQKGIIDLDGATSSTTSTKADEKSDISGNSSTIISNSMKALGITSTTKLLYMNILNSLPSLRYNRDNRDDGVASSLTSTNNDGDELDESHHSGTLARSMGSNLSNSYEEHRFFSHLSTTPGFTTAYMDQPAERHSRRRSGEGSTTLPIHVDVGPSGDHIVRLDSKASTGSGGIGGGSAALASAQYYYDLVKVKNEINNSFSPQSQSPSTIESLKELITKHDSLMNYYFAKVKPDPATVYNHLQLSSPPSGKSNADSTAVNSPADINAVSSEEKKGSDNTPGIENIADSIAEEGHSPLLPPPPPPPAKMASPTKSILKNSTSSVSLLGSSHNSLNSNSGSISADFKEYGLKEATKEISTSVKIAKIEDGFGTSITPGLTAGTTKTPNQGNRGNSNWRMGGAVGIPTKLANDHLKAAYKSALGKGGNNPRMNFPPPELTRNASGGSTVAGGISSMVASGSARLEAISENQERERASSSASSSAKHNSARLSGIAGSEKKIEENRDSQVTTTPPPQSSTRNQHSANPVATGKTLVLSAAKKPKLSAKNFVSRNQMVKNLPMAAVPRHLMFRNGLNSNESEKPAFAFHHGKIIPLPGVDNTKQKEKEILDYITNYASQYSINPFRLKEGEKYLSSITHNRRRWSHVFPSTRHERVIDYGLNWKSLTQPAILPLNTDYLPSVKDLDRYYTVSQYTVTFVKEDSPFNTLQSALKELVAQRLSREFQLVEGFDKSLYFRISSYDNVIDVNRRDSYFHNFFILTMGHRIHFLLGDDVENKIYVTCFLSKKSQTQEDIEGKESTEKEMNSLTGFSYNYEMWIIHRKQFQGVNQKFYQFPKQEYLWNRLDNNIITGELDYDKSVTQDLKPRNLHFLLIPNELLLTNDEEVNEFFNKINQFIEFINKYTLPLKDPSNKMEFVKDATLIQRLSPIEASNNKEFTPSIEGSDNQKAKEYWINRPIKYYKKSMKSIYSKTVKCLMRPSDTGNPAWLYINYDSHLFTYKAFHIEFRWFACDSWLIDELVTLMYRRCTRFGLRLVQTPSYFNSNNLNIHPYRPAPYLMIPNHYTTSSTSAASSSSSANPVSVAPVTSALSGIVTSGLTATLSAPSTPSTGVAGASGGFSKPETFSTSTSTTQSSTSTTNQPGSTNSSSNNVLAGLPPLSAPVPLPLSSGPTVFTISSLHSSALRLIERIYFIHSHDWMFDSEECTKWDLIGLNIPNYSDRDRDLYNDELLAPYIPQQQSSMQGGFSMRGGINSSATSGISSKPVGTKAGVGTPSLQKTMFRNKSGDEESNPNLLTSGSNTPTSGSSSNLIGIGAVEKTSTNTNLATQSNEVIEGRTHRADSNVSTRGYFGLFDSAPNAAPPLPGPTGSIQSVLTNMKGKKDRPENKRIDRQYVHVLGIATVRVAAHGFLWFSSSTTKISDMNMSIEDKTAISMKAMHQLELHCEVVNDIYEIILDAIDNTFKHAFIREILFDLVDEIETKKTSYQISNANSQVPSQNHSNTSSPTHSFYPRTGSGREGWTTPKSPPIGVMNHSNGSSPSPYISVPHSPQRSTSFRHQAVGTAEAGINLEGQSHSASFSAMNSPTRTTGKMPSSSALPPNLDLDLELIHSASMKDNSGFTFSNPMGILSSKVSPISSGKRTATTATVPLSESNLVSPAPVKAYQQSAVPTSNPLKLKRGKNLVESSSSSSDDESSHHSGTPVQLLYSSKDSREGSTKSGLSNPHSSSGRNSRSTTLSPSLTPGVTPTAAAHPPNFQPPSLP